MPHHIRRNSKPFLPKWGGWIIGLFTAGILIFVITVMDSGKFRRIPSTPEKQPARRWVTDREIRERGASPLYSRDSDDAWRKAREDDAGTVEFTIEFERD